MFKKLLKNIVCVSALVVAGLSTANATVIQQDIEADLAGDGTFEVIGNVVVHTAQADEWGIVESWVDFSLLDFGFLTEDEANFYDPFGFQAIPLFGYFVAEVDTFDPLAGLLSLSFDVTDNSFAYYNFNGGMDAFGGGTLDVFDEFGELFIFGETRFGAVTQVPETTMFVLFLTGLAGFALRRKA